MANKDSFDAFVSIIRDKIDELSENTDQSRIQVFQNELKEKFDDLARSQGYVSSKEYDALENLAARLEERITKLENQLKK
jgi:polyhydroxyalkanoate synthesis regulator phasin